MKRELPKTLKVGKTIVHAHRTKCFDSDKGERCVSFSFKYPKKSSSRAMLEASVLIGPDAWGKKNVLDMNANGFSGDEREHDRQMDRLNDFAYRVARKLMPYAKGKKGALGKVTRRRRRR